MTELVFDRLEKTLWEKEKMPAISIISFVRVI